MNADEYVLQRLDDQINWYDHKSQWNQRWYRRLRVVEFLAAALIPFLAGYVAKDSMYINLTIGILGVLIAAITGITSLYSFQGNWIEYRTTCESLKHKKFLFLTKTEPYDTEESFSCLVQHVETSISKENSDWSQSATTEKGSKSNGYSGLEKLDR